MTGDVAEEDKPESSREDWERVSIDLEMPWARGVVGKSGVAVGGDLLAEPLVTTLNGSS